VPSLFLWRLTLASAALFLLPVVHASSLGEPLPDGGGWGILPTPVEHISEAEQAANRAAVERNIALLERQQRLPTKAAEVLRFGWPTRSALGRSEPYDHVITNYIDHDTAVDSVQDYACGTRTYDTSSPGGGHKGTDIGIGGARSFFKMDTEQVVVVAAADGTIVQKDDSNPDRSCGDLAALFANGGLRNNLIAVRHVDGSIGYYYHVKTGSLTPKKIGDSVVAGEYLGAVGSSGFSSGPHLHFELRTAANAVIDPWSGDCNPGPKTWRWQDQEPYKMPEILSLMPTSVAPTFENTTTACVDNVAVAEPGVDYVQPDLYAQAGFAHHFVAFVRDLEAPAVIQFALKRPNGTTFATSALTASVGFASSAYGFMTRTIPASEPAGKWTFEATYGGKTKSTPFFFNVPRPIPAWVHEFYNGSLRHFFRTAAEAEAQSLTPVSGFLPTGDDFFSLDRSMSFAGTQPVCRFYGSPDPGPNSHFYTADPAECQALKDLQARTPPTEPRWNFEENAFTAYLPVSGRCPAEAPFPIYRLYNKHQGETINGVREDSNHRFTTLSSVYYQMAGTGWGPEGVVMCSSGKP